MIGVRRRRPAPVLPTPTPAATPTAVVTPSDRLTRAVTDLLGRSGAARAAVTDRARTVLDALDAPVPGRTDPVDLLAAVGDAVAPVDPARAWLILAVLTGRIPSGDQVVSAVRRARLDGERAMTAEIVEEMARERADERADHGRPSDEESGTDPDGSDPSWPAVRVVQGRHLVDVHHTSAANFVTGIQRVTREACRRWRRDHGPLLIGWLPDFSAMRMLSPAEADRACHGGPPAPDSAEPVEILVPWRCTYILPELAAEVVRASHLQCLGQYSGTSVNLIGYDLVPITTAETSHEGLVPGFARNLAGARYARVIVPIAEGAAEEYRGWRAMLAGAGLTGPRIEPVVLPTERPPLDRADLEAAQRRLSCGALDLVLVVGSHEPRKNHVAVLHAAERLWREGRRFSLTFIGGNSWNSEEYSTTLADLQAAGRPVETISAATDALLWGGYQLARFTVFPSINEGYGLPVAESLVSGTPVVTSGYGTMKEIADAGGGALLVDPRDDDSLTDAMRRLLVDDELRAELSAQASARRVRTWDEYAAQTWALLSDPGPTATATKEDE